MPAKMHTFYLRNMYIKNLLAKPGGITLGGEPHRSRRRCTTPVVLRVDHRRPHRAVEDRRTWVRSCSAGRSKFILGGSGHIAGIVNPPAANKYQLLDDPTSWPATADEWLASAQRNDGSWWPAWNEWVSQFGGEKVPARKPGRRQAESDRGCTGVVREAASGSAAAEDGACGSAGGTTLEKKIEEKPARLWNTVTARCSLEAVTCAATTEQVNARTKRKRPSK